MKPETSIIERLRLPVAAPRRAGDDDNMDTYVNQALMSAVHAFSSRWLPAGFFNTTGSDDQAARRRFMQTLWDQAHADVLCVLTLPCYRSILALYLFAITPLVGSSAMHPVSQMCYETSLRHYLQLRLESRISLPDVGPNQHVPNSTDRDELDHLEDSAYWFGIVCDVSRSLLRCQPPIVLSGPSAHARVWQLVSRQVEDFAAQSISMHTSKDILDDATVLQILQMGSSCKTMCWAAITDVQDTLFYERTSLSFQQSLSFCLDMLQQFEAIFLPLLDKCARDFLLLSDKSRLGYVWLVLHFNLGVLILADTLVAGSVALTLDNQVSIDEHRLASTRAVVNVINLVRQLDSFNMDQPSLLLRDPYPEHASNCLNRAAKSVLGLVQAATITADAAAIFASALLQGLQIISQISFSASEALPTLLNLLHDNGIPVSAKHSSSQTPMGANVSIVLDSAVTPEMLEHETLKELGQQAATDPALVSKTIERHEAAEATPNFGLDYLQFIDFTAVTGDWDFDDCFAGA
ncbi:uncharacterized protein HMPREF1541_05145 [Cyphellophora europaea CBS 101466]|uniref:Transcription factor domain-containing protein n=1 Tax=Cyphellophora europaea (strain CBS 101466) TaxID=1220924 RepID=W2RX47_CYPE1|nr:uncharacterized protein HMPREF1541_05145 [Cyphellophora europaea CBS 101466]ETN40865.1 hypothetical protein HMPREF1541_05145 [Cyphellophora europaea CBS 101466]